LSPDGTRLYFRIGSGVMAYDATSFINRLAAGTGTVDAGAVPTNPSNANTAGIGKKPPFESLLQFDSWFYPEYTGLQCTGYDENAKVGTPAGCWLMPRVDSQDRLYTIDVDDQGYVYMAYDVFAWGIAKDPGGARGELMSSLFQANPDTLNGVSPKFAAVLKSAGHYYTLIGDRSAPTTLAYDVSDRTHPAPLRAFSRGVLSLAKNRAMDKFAIVDTAYGFSIWDTSSLPNGGSPLLQVSANSGKFQAVTSDGTNFYALAPGAGDTSTMAVYSPSGSTYVQSAEYSLPSKFTAYSMQYNAGYTVCASQPGTGGWDVRIFKMQGTKPVSVDTKPYYNGAVQSGSYFVNYYSGAPAGYTS